MKFRNADYIKRRKAQRHMQHPTDLKTFLQAELTLCTNKVVREHIKKTLEALDSEYNKQQDSPEQ